MRAGCPIARGGTETAHSGGRRAARVSVNEIVSKGIYRKVTGSDRGAVGRVDGVV